MTATTNAPSAPPTPQPSPPPGSSRRRTSREQFLWGLGVLVLILAVMQIGSLFTPSYVFPSVPDIFAGVVEILRTSPSDIAATIVRFIVALLLAMFVGWFLGLLMGTFRVAGKILKPVFAILQSVPALSWVLISVIWLHNVEARILFIVFLIAIPFFVIAVYEGIRNIDTDMVEAIKQFRPSKWQLLRYLYVPHSVTYVLMTLKTASAFCLRILVFAELIGAASGIGYAMGFAQANFRIDLIFAWTIILVALNFLLNIIIGGLEKRLLSWRTEVSPA